MKPAVAELERHAITYSESFQRRGPYLLLMLATAVAIGSAGFFDRADSIPILGIGAALIALLHWWCADRRWDQRLDDWVGAAYVWTRTVMNFVLSWLNPFFAIFALIVYFDSDKYVGRRQRIAILAIGILTMAGSQSGGFPFQYWAQLPVFAGLCGLHAGLIVYFSRLERREAQVGVERDRIIDELEQSNTELGAAIAEKNRLQETLIEQAREAGVHAERERLALEIHDTIAQNLTGIITQLQAAQNTSEAARTARHQDHAIGLAREALGEARRSLAGLLPRRLEGAALGGALHGLVAEWEQASGVSVDVVIDGEVAKLHPDIETTVLRVAQEALTNVEKHATAHRVGVTLSYMGDVLTLDVRDDGTGFSPAATERSLPGSAVGLQGIRQRAARVAGAVVVESEVGVGTAVFLKVPAVPQPTGPR